MHFHLPKPLHGWREFAGEVGIIVIGVLVALSAEQLVESWHSHRQLAQTRSALRSEVARNLGSMQFNVHADSCIKRRLDELETWLGRARAGNVMPLTHPIGRPSQYGVWTSVWDTVKSTDATAKMPVNERVTYGRAYGIFANVDELLNRQRDMWWSVAQFNNATSLDHGDQMRLQQLISNLRIVTRVIAINGDDIHSITDNLHIQPEQVPLYAPDADRVFCEPLFSHQ